MNLTPAQIISLLSLVVGLFTTIAPLTPDPHLVSTIGGALITFLGGVSTVLTGQGAQVKTVVGNIDNPTVKRAVVAAVSTIPGIDPIQINHEADAALVSVAVDPSVPKVQLAKS